MRKVRGKPAKPARMVAYDFETTRIEPGTPRPLYLTAFGLDPECSIETPIRDLAHLREIVTGQLLVREFHGVKFVAWYGNGFDAYFVAVSLIGVDEYVVRPYLTRNNALRGLRVVRREHLNVRNAPSWEFLDGQAQLGLVGVSLEKFLANFAPAWGKHTGAVDFEREQFDATNPKHRAYAWRDSEGLYYAMIAAQRILMDNFGEPLAVTMGGACIRIFQANIPEGVTVNTPRNAVLDIIRTHVMRGGFCYCARRYKGPVWKYDINQAYAAAMRDALLPCGFTSHDTSGELPQGVPYLARLTARNPRNRAPFYYRSEVDGRMRSLFASTSIADTWLTSIEVEQLAAEGWALDVSEVFAWDGGFSMTEYVNALERGRMSAEGGPSGPIGTVYKNVGNHSYGKTVSQDDPIEYVIAEHEPPGDEWAPFYADEAEPLPYVWWRFVEDKREKAYQQPQLGAFITAHVRMVLRRAILIDPAAWLYADTDCVVFSRDVTDRLDIHPSRYGAWKVEDAGTVYSVIAKKVYTQDASPEVRAAWSTMTPAERAKAVKRSAKGLNVKRLTPEDFDRWYEGEPPEQDQTQRNNFLAVMRGAEMYRLQARSGTAVEGKVHRRKNRVS